MALPDTSAIEDLVKTIQHIWQSYENFKAFLVNAWTYFKLSIGKLVMYSFIGVIGYFTIRVSGAKDCRSLARIFAFFTLCAIAYTFLEGWIEYAKYRKEHPVQEVTIGAFAVSDYDPDLVSKWVTGDTDCSPILLQRLAAIGQGHKKVVNITSGYRSMAEQQTIWNAHGGSNGGYIAKPGNSPHQSGQAADVGGWLKEGIANGSITDQELVKYGLIRRLKGAVNEPWHIETTEYQEVVSGKLSKEEFYKIYGGGPDFNTAAWKAARTKNIAVSGDIDDWIDQAINITGIDKSWHEPLKWIAWHESRNDPAAVNKKPVGNEHATGLMQTLPSTFKANCLPGYNDILNPVHNLVAAIRYIQGRYGYAQKVVVGWAERGGY